VFDKDDLDRIPAPTDPSPNATDTSYVIEETSRQAANFPTVIVGQNWLLGVIESNKPLPPTGPKRVEHQLTPRQRQFLEALPSARPQGSP
jgi:hypothetical protein